jgi:cell division protein YceG involved in septum cleavage
MEYILSNAEIAKTFKPVNITRYDKPVNNKYPYKQELMPADLPDLIVQLNGMVPNRNSSCDYVEIYNFQATITTGAWNLDQSTTAHALMDWLIEGNNNMQGLDWGEGYHFFKVEVLPMQIANVMPDKNRNLSGFVYAVFFNVQVSRAKGG